MVKKILSHTYYSMNTIPFTGTIAILGASGRQGGSVGEAIDKHRSLLPDTKITIRALTRKPESLAKPWIKDSDQVIYCDLDQPDTIATALDGCDFLFVITDYWEYHDPTRETQHLANIAKSVSEMSTPIQGVVVSTLEAPPPLPHNIQLESFTSKSEGQPYFQQYGIPVVFMYPSFFWEDLLSWFPIHHNPRHTYDSNCYRWSFPMESYHHLAGMSLVDLGEIVVGILTRFHRFSGYHVKVCGEINGIDEIRWYMEYILQNRYNRSITITLDTLSLDSLESSSGNELGHIFQYYQTVPADSRRYSDVAKLIYPNMLCFYAWLQQNYSKLLSEYK